MKIFKELTPIKFDSWTLKPDFREALNEEFPELKHLSDKAISYKFELIGITHYNKQIKSKKSFKMSLIRLSYPLFIIALIFTVLIIMPARYIVTGNAKLSHKDRYAKFMRKWIELLETK